MRKGRGKLRLGRARGKPRLEFETHCVMVKKEFSYRVSCVSSYSRRESFHLGVL